MLKKLNQKILFCFVIFYSFSCEGVINESRIKSCMGALAGACIGDQLGKLISNRANLGYWIPSTQLHMSYENINKSLFLIDGIALLTAFAGYNLVHYFTPAGRLQRAKKKIDSIDKAMIESAKIEDCAIFSQRMGHIFIVSPYPLACAYYSYIEIYNKLIEARELLLLAKNEYFTDANYDSEVESLVKNVTQYIALVSNGLTMLKSFPELMVQINVRSTYESLKVQADMRSEMEFQSYLQIMNGRRY